MRSKRAQYQAEYMARIKSSPEHRLIVLKQSWHFQKSRAAKRGIEFLLSFEEWLKVWEDSGRLGDRGKRKHQYCMSRNGDVGPYAVGNVSIITMAENKKLQRPPFLGRKLTDEHKAKLSLSKMGNTYGRFRGKNKAPSLEMVI
jgi:hypothetical protein